jgi:hypothetical protein
LRITKFHFIALETQKGYSRSFFASVIETIIVREGIWKRKRERKEGEREVGLMEQRRGYGN